MNYIMVELKYRQRTATGLVLCSITLPFHNYVLRVAIKYMSKLQTNTYSTSPVILSLLVLLWVTKHTAVKLNLIQSLSVNELDFKLLYNRLIMLPQIGLL